MYCNLHTCIQLYMYNVTVLHVDTWTCANVSVHIIQGGGKALLTEDEIQEGVHQMNQKADYDRSGTCAIYTCIYMYMYDYVYMHMQLKSIYMYMYMYIYMYIYINNHMQRALQR